mgnify:CR=1 FL=1
MVLSFKLTLGKVDQVLVLDLQTVYTLIMQVQGKESSLASVFSGLVLLLVFGIWYQKRGVENTKNTQEQYASETEHTVLTGTPYKETENAYIIRTQDSRLVVFLPDGKTVYMETGIRSENLSQKLQKQAENGIGFADEESLFDFLESYSS